MTSTEALDSQRHHGDQHLSGVGDRRLRVLSRLNDLVPATESDLDRRLAAILADNAQDHPFVVLYRLVGEGDAQLVSAFGIAPGAPAAPHHLAGGGPDQIWPIGAICDGKRLRLPIQGRGGDAGPALGEGISEALVLPVRAGRFTLPVDAWSAPGRAEVDRDPSSEITLRSVFMQAPAAIAILHGPDHIFTFANPLYLEMTSRDSLVGLGIRAAFPEAAGSGIFELLDTVYRTGEPFATSEYPVPIIKRQGSPPEQCYFTFNLHPLRDRDGVVFGQIAVAIEITAQVAARRQLEAQAATLALHGEELKHSEARFRGLADAMPQIVWIADPRGGIEFFNARWRHSTGLQHEPGGMDLMAALKPWLHADDLAGCSDRWRRARSEEAPFEAEFRFLDQRSGAWQWMLARAVPVRDASGRIAQWYGTMTDIDAQRRAEVAARDTGESLSQAIAATGIGTWDYSPGSGDLRWSDSCRAIWGLPHGAPVVFQSWVAAIHDEDRPAVLVAMERALQGVDGGRYAVEFRMRRFDSGDERWLAAAGQVLFDAQGAPLRFLGTTSEITERKRTEAIQHFLDAARLALAASLDADRQLEALAAAAVPGVADWCVIDRVVEGARQPLCHIHADPERAATARRIRASISPSSGRTRGSAPLAARHRTDWR